MQKVSQADIDNLVESPHKKVGPWRDYLYGEFMYIVLSLVAKSLLAWQVFAGTLRP